MTDTTSMTQIVSDAVKEFRTSVPDCLASAIIDMSTGMLLAVDTVDSHPDEVLDLLAAATFDIFQGRNVVMIEEIFNQRRGVRTADHYFQEILINSQNLVHLFMRSATNAEIVVAVVCRRTVNIGMLFAQSRLVMRRLDSDVA
jgi:hypothetical protein